MLTGNTRRLIVFGALVSGLVALVSLWPDSPSGEASRRWRTDGARAPASAPRSADNANAPASSAGNGSSSAGVAGAEARATETSDRMSVPPLRLRVHAPSDVQVGEVFQARIDLEAHSPLRQLMFTVNFEKSRLVLVGWSEGSFVRQDGLSAELGAQEPSDGNIDVNFIVGNGLAAAGAGNIAVFQFEAIRAGTSGITLQNVTAFDSSGATVPNVAIPRAGSVTIH